MGKTKIIKLINLPCFKYNLWSHISWCPANSSQRTGHLCRQTKVSKFQGFGPVYVLTNQEILRLDVAMNDIHGM